MASNFYESVDYYKNQNVPRKPGDPDRYMEVVFTPDTEEELAIACIYAHWRNPDPNGADLWSFAFVTTEPPPEVDAAGHNRCIMPIKHERIDEWLQPEPGNLQKFYGILDDRMRPYYNNKPINKEIDS